MLDSDDLEFLEEIKRLLFNRGIESDISSSVGTNPTIYHLNVLDDSRFDDASELIYCSLPFLMELQDTKHQTLLLEKRKPIESWITSILKSKYYWMAVLLIVVILMVSQVI